MVVLPLHFNLLRGTHRPPIRILVVFVVFILFKIVHQSMAVPTECQLQLPGHTEVKRKFLYIKDKEKPITLMTSRRIPHQLLTRVVSIFLRRYLGYEKVVFTYQEGFFPDDVFRAMGFGHDIYSTPEDFYPNALANMEVWTPPKYNVDELNPLTTDSYLGVVGRLGWFFPTYVIEQYNVLDHWRTFANSESESLRVFSRSNDELEATERLRKDNVTGEYYCSDRKCVRGIYTPPLCAKRTCALLFASYYNQSNFLIDHVTNSSLYVKIAWLGPNLNIEFVRSNLRYPGDRSILFYHYTPDVLLRPFDLTSVAFPSCSDHIEYSKMNKSYFCMYEMHRFNKFIWSDLKDADDFLFRSLKSVTLSTQEYDSLITAYNENPLKDLDEIACDWMNKNPSVWEFWSNGEEKQSLVLVGLFPIVSTFNKKGKFLDPGNVPAFIMGIDAVNANESILPDHHIIPMLLNTGCEPDIVMLEFIKLIQATTRIGQYTKLIGIVGPACSDTVQPIAGVSKYFNMPIISYGAEGATFTDREQYPYFFRTIPENKIFRNVYLQIFKKFNWRRAASLTEDGHQYSEYLTPLQDLLQDNGINFNMRKYPHGRKTLNMTQYLLDLKKQNYRIIIGEFYQEEARSVMCEAYHQEMTGHQGYVWFVPWWYAKNWYDVDFWNQNDSLPVPCTTKEIIYALQGHMSLSYKYYGNDDSKTPANEYIWQWRKKYRDKTEKFKFHESDYAGFTYDAVWTYALALHKLFQDDDAYTANLRSINTTERFIYYINNTNFDGVSGHINFTHGPSRLTDILIWQFTNKSYRHVGTFYPSADDHDNGGRLEVKKKLAWPTGTPPSDGSEECIVEGLRVLLGKDTSCSSAIIALCLTSFFSFGFIFVATILTLRRRYETRLRAIEAMWKNQSIFKKFEGWEIPRTKVVINRILGEGQFGTVYGGECLDDVKGWVAVAVKTLKDGSTSAEKLDFLSEAEMMKNFEHENIVKLLGVCTDGEPIYTVMEFMLYGDLKTYLLARRHLVNEKNRNDDDEVSNHRLTSMALDVAKALEYLSTMKYVHRDIACRNCLVNTVRSVKLADFGMTRPLNEKNYYRFSRKGMLPVRWMAPESLTEGVFTTSSDIWSYGVLLYEIITFGAFPFQGLNNNQVFEKVKSGQTLPIPSGILPGLECLLQACWHPVPSKRLTAEQIVMHLENSPRLVSPSLEGPHASLPIEDAAGLELRIPDKTRKLSLSLNSRAMLAQSMGVGGGTSMGAGMSMGHGHGHSHGHGQGMQGTANGRRKRSMSGNMMVTIPSLTASLSEDGTIPSYNLEALNLNQVMIEEIGERDMGEDPLLPPSQYISSRIMSLSHRDIERSISGISKEKWTSITPV